MGVGQTELFYVIFLSFCGAEVDRRGAGQSGGRQGGAVFDGPAVSSVLVSLFPCALLSTGHI